MIVGAGTAVIDRELLCRFLSGSWKWRLEIDIRDREGGERVRVKLYLLLGSVSNFGRRVPTSQTEGILVGGLASCEV